MVAGQETRGGQPGAAFRPVTGTCRVAGLLREPAGPWGAGVPFGHGPVGPVTARKPLRGSGAAMTYESGVSCSGTRALSGQIIPLPANGAGPYSGEPSRVSGCRLWHRKPVKKPVVMIEAGGGSRRRAGYNTPQPVPECRHYNRFLFDFKRLLLRLGRGMGASLECGEA